MDRVTGGSDLARNLIVYENEMIFPDLIEIRTSAFWEMGWTVASSAVDPSMDFDAVMVMAMNGNQAKSVIPVGADLKGSIAPDKTVIVVAAAAKLHDRSWIGHPQNRVCIHLINSPLSDSMSSEECGTSGMMASMSNTAPGSSMPTMNPVLETLKASAFVAKAESKGIASSRSLHRSRGWRL